MSKEEILKEFGEKFTCDCGQSEDIHYSFDMDGKDVKRFLSKALDTMREETLREVEEELDGLDCGFCNYESEVKERLAKLKTNEQPNL